MLLLQNKWQPVMAAHTLRMFRTFIRITIICMITDVRVYVMAVPRKKMHVFETFINPLQTAAC